jgi:hypothetical protein
VTTDLSLAKTVPFGSSARVQLRAEIFNLFDTANFFNPNGVWGTANFGRITQAFPMRQIQLGARFLF